MMMMMMMMMMTTTRGSLSVVCSVKKSRIGRTFPKNTNTTTPQSQLRPRRQPPRLSSSSPPAALELEIANPATKEAVDQIVAMSQTAIAMFYAYVFMSSALNYLFYKRINDECGGDDDDDKR
jgi:hypothetical protein